MGLLRIGKQVPKPINFEAFETYRKISGGTQNKEIQVEDTFLFEFNKYDEAFSGEAIITNETALNILTNSNLFTADKDFLITNYSLAGCVVAGTPTFIRYSIEVARGGKTLFFPTQYLVAVKQIANASGGVRNFLIKKGDVVNLVIRRTVTACSYRIWLTLNVIALE